MKGITYRNYFIYRREDGRYNILQQADGLIITVEPSQAEAVAWVDRERAQMRAEFR